MIEYEIIKINWVDSNGVEHNPRYQIRWRCSYWLFNLKYWKYATGHECNMSDCCMSTIDFNSKEEAESYIHEILCTETKTDTTIVEVISTVKCIK